MPDEQSPERALSFEVLLRGVVIRRFGYLQDRVDKLSEEHEQLRHPTVEHNAESGDGWVLDNHCSLLVLGII